MLPTLLGSGLLFAAVSGLLLFVSPWQPALYPLYGLLFFWNAFRKEEEAPVIFLFLATAAGMILMLATGAPDLKIIFFLQIVGLWSLAWGISAHRERALADHRKTQAETARTEAAVKDQSRDLDYYRSFQEEAEAQLRLRRDLAESARSLGSTLSAADVQNRLVSILSARFPEVRVRFAPMAGSDPLLQLASRKRGPVSIKDAADERRLEAGHPPFRSALALPLKVMQREAGFLILESDKPAAFTPEDVKTADVIATMASVSLENIHFYDMIHSQAIHDPLTQLFSHKAFQTRLDEELLRAGRNQTPLSLIMYDLDHFKSYNDRYGHQAGDLLLKTVASILVGFARPVDFPARYGGEEFCLILPNFVRTEAVDLANRLRQRIADEPFIFQGQRTSVTASFGVSSFPQDATSASQMIRVADERLYRAKKGGRNQVAG